MSRLAAQTSGSALGVLVLSCRLTCTPLATPSTPVTQVMAPKIRLSEEKHGVRVLLFLSNNTFHVKAR